MSVLEVKNLSVHFAVGAKIARAVDDISFVLEEGKTHALVGESGCGKSVTALSIMGLLPRRHCMQTGAIIYQGDNLLKKSAQEFRSLRGKSMGMIFQEPMTALNPVMKVGSQIKEAVHLHADDALKPGQTEYERVIELLGEMGLRDPVNLYNRYPHELSGGMRQRIMIAIALACNPSILVADEPTTALDVTVQKQILNLLKTLQETHGMAILLITHDMSVVGRVADSMSVMYAGNIVESGPAQVVFKQPCHPYTQALFAALPGRAAGRSRLEAIPGNVPPATQYDQMPSACRFYERCRYQDARCHKKPEAPGHISICRNELKA
jgi:oligopeptide/dipeptide ABC transporter ATP-binding protein